MKTISILLTICATLLLFSCDGNDSTLDPITLPTETPEDENDSDELPTQPTINLPENFSSEDTINIEGDDLPEQLFFFSSNRAATITYTWDLAPVFNEEQSRFEISPATINNAESNTRILINTYRFTETSRFRTIVQKAILENRTITIEETEEIIQEINSGLALPIVFLTNNGDMALAETWSFYFTEIEQTSSNFFEGNINATRSGRVYEFNPYPVLTEEEYNDNNTKQGTFRMQIKN